MSEINYTYEKMREDGTIQFCPGNDYDGSVTGQIVMDVRAWFDENPEERKRLGWIKHIHPGTKDIAYNPSTQVINTMQRCIDDYTVIDEYEVEDLTEEHILLRLMLDTLNYSSGSFITLLDGGR